MKRNPDKLSFTISIIASNKVLNKLVIEYSITYFVLLHFIYYYMYMINTGILYFAPIKIFPLIHYTVSKEHFYTNHNRLKELELIKGSGVKGTRKFTITEEGYKLIDKFEILVNKYSQDLKELKFDKTT